MTKFLSVLTIPLVLGIANSTGADEAPPSTRPIPALDSKGDVYKTSGETDPLIYKDAIGRKKLIMLYLDFGDGVMEIDTPERAQQVLGRKTFEDLFARMSHGKLSFDIEQVPGWRRLLVLENEIPSSANDILLVDHSSSAWILPRLIWGLFMFSMEPHPASMCITNTSLITDRFRIP